MDLENKVIVVTGAARGLGAAMAKRLATHRTKLGLIDLEESSLETTAACLQGGWCGNRDVWRRRIQGR